MNPRKLEPSDYHKGYLELLKDLTVVGDIQEQDFIRQCQILSAPPYNIYVIEAKGQIVATGTLLVEHKVIHSLGKVGHIEDIVVSKGCQGQNLGKKIIDKLVNVAKEQGCYKVILDCSENVRGFYQKCGFTEKGIMMRLDVPLSQSNSVYDPVPELARHMPTTEHNCQKVLKSLTELRLNDLAEIKKMTPDELQRIYPDHSWTFEYPHLATQCDHCGANYQRDECLARFCGMFCVCIDCFDLYYDEANVEDSLKTLYHATRNKYYTYEIEGEWNEGMRKTRSATSNTNS